jgi:pimeloyl-ACP methyl ester carboxylesterase
VNPLFIGTAERRIFGVYEPAVHSRGRPRAAVLCNPWGSEYIYAHRSLRRLAARLSKAGFHTLRFDYFGTGDSAGEETETDPAGLGRDAETAIEALKDIADTPKVALIGLRMGANVAASVASRVPSDVEALVLWDPFVSAEFRSTLDALPQRSMIVVTERLSSHEELSGPTAIEFVTAPCPWVESVTTTGALPVRVIQRIEEWLR